MNENDFKKLFTKWESTGYDHGYYFDNLFPDVSERLNKQIGAKIEAGEITRYDSLMIIVGHNQIPQLMMINAIRSSTVSLLYQPQNRERVRNIRERLSGVYKPEDIIEIELSGNEHRANIGIIRDSIREMKMKGLRILCDVTAGKKILSTQLGIIAHQEVCDLAYLDGETIVKGGIPFPGTEYIFIQEPTDHFTSTKECPRLQIRFNSTSGNIGYEMMIDDLSRYSEKTPDKEDFTAITNEINRITDGINRGIKNNDDLMNDLGELSNLIDNYLIPREVGEMFRMMNGVNELRVMLQDELCGIPWEIPLLIVYGIHPPVQRILRLESRKIASGKNKGTGDILLIEGSTDGIDTYSQIKNSLMASIQRMNKVNVETVRAESSSMLKSLLSRRSGEFSMIVYFGHSQYKDEQSAGWICRDGSIFTAGSLSCMDRTPPEILISNGCESARATPFRSDSFSRAVMNMGCRTFIGTHWLLEMERSALFLHTFIDSVYEKEKDYFSAYSDALKMLAERFGDNDISRYNYVYYGK